MAAAGTGADSVSYPPFFDNGEGSVAWADRWQHKTINLNNNYTAKGDEQAYRYQIDHHKPIFSTGKNSWGDPIVVYHTKGLQNGIVIGYKDEEACLQEDRD